MFVIYRIKAVPFIITIKLKATENFFSTTTLFYKSIAFTKAV
jgi:hypothetical protein